MPCNKRSRPDGRAVPSSKKAKKEYQMLDNIGYVEDRCHSLFRDLPSRMELVSKLIGKCIVSMLNTAGGIVAFGVRPTGIIYGEKISRREEDLLKCTIDDAIKRIAPCVSCHQYSVRFTPVAGEIFMDNSAHSRQVLEIRVDQDLYELYEDNNHKAFSRDGAFIVGPLTPHQIKKITIEKLKNKIRSDKHRADLLSPGPLRPSARLCTNNSVKTGSNFPWKASKSKDDVENSSTKKAGNSKDDAIVISISNKLAKIAGNSKDGTVEISSVTKKSGNSKDGAVEISSVTNKAGNSKKGAVKISISNKLAKKAGNSKDGTVEISSVTNKAGNSKKGAVAKIAGNSKKGAVAKIAGNRKKGAVAKIAGNSKKGAVAKIAGNSKKGAVAKIAGKKGAVAKIAGNSKKGAVAKIAGNIKDGAVKISSVTKIAGNSKDDVGSDGHVEESRTVKLMSSKAQKEDKENVSSSFIERVGLTMTCLKKKLTFMTKTHSSRPCSSWQPNNVGASYGGPTGIAAASKYINTNLTSTGGLFTTSSSFVPTYVVYQPNISMTPATRLIPAPRLPYTHHKPPSSYWKDYYQGF